MVCSQMLSSCGASSEYVLHSGRCTFAAFSQPRVTSSRSRVALRVVANKKVKKIQEVVLTQDVQGFGVKGAVTKVPLGFMRNYLKPRGLASPATEAVFEALKRADEAVEKEKREAKAKAQAMATALATIGKFIIKKKAAKDDKLFGSVSGQDVVDAIEMQTGRKLDKKDLSLPEISSVGSYPVTIKLHPEVTGQFTLMVQREKGASGK